MEPTQAAPAHPIRQPNLMHVHGGDKTSHGNASVVPSVAEHNQATEIIDPDTGEITTP